MKEKYDVIIIGGGFSGVIAAINVAESKKKILLLEKNDRLCKKVASTGNGRGNISNMSISADFYHGDKGAIGRVLDRYGRDFLLDYFGKLGLLTVTENGRIYPCSMQASSISDLMRLKLSNLKNVYVKTSYQVTDIKKDYDGYVINGEFSCDRLIISVGGKSMKNFGTDGNLFPLLKKLGVIVTELSPSLVQIKTQTEKIRGLKGIKQTAKITLLDRGSSVVSFEGDLLFTDSGISGDSVFRLSAYLSETKEPYVKIEFVPEYSKEKLTEFLLKKAELEYVNNEHLPIGIVNNRLGLTLLKCAGLSATDKANENSVYNFCKVLKDFELKVVGTFGYDYSQVTHGGVDFKQVDDNLQFKNSKGLYFCGEILNVDGDCGGYNLQWAFSSAMVVSEAINDSFKR